MLDRPSAAMFVWKKKHFLYNGPAKEDKTFVAKLSVSGGRLGYVLDATELPVLSFLTL